MRKRITLGFLALALSATALIGTARRAEAQSCPLCVVGEHCCVFNGNPVCVSNSNPC